MCARVCEHAEKVKSQYFVPCIGQRKLNFSTIKVSVRTQNRVKFTPG